jgi:hypothetical protein
VFGSAGAPITGVLSIFSSSSALTAFDAQPTAAMAMMPSPASVMVICLRFIVLSLFVGLVFSVRRF